MVAAGIGLFAKRIGKTCQSSIGHIVFESVGNGVVKGFTQWAIAIAQIVVVVGAKGIASSRCVGSFAHRFVGEGNVEVAQSLHPRVDNDRYGRVALHGVSFLPIKFPFRQPARFAILVEHGAHHSLLSVREEKGEELVGAAISVPKREHGVAVARSAASDAGLHFGIFAVDVLEDVGVDLCVIERGVEDGALVRRAAFDGDHGECLFPRTFGSGAHIGKVGALGLFVL